MCIFVIAKTPSSFSASMQKKSMETHIDKRTNNAECHDRLLYRHLQARRLDNGRRWVRESRKHLPYVLWSLWRRRGPWHKGRRLQQYRNFVPYVLHSSRPCAQLKSADKILGFLRLDKTNDGRTGCTAGKNKGKEGGSLCRMGSEMQRSQRIRNNICKHKERACRRCPL